MVYRPESLLERLELLRQYGADLTQWRDLSLDDYLRSRTTKYAVERLLFLVAGTVLDMLDHVLSARHEVVSDSYEEIVTNAHRHALISSDLYGALRGLGGFRDVLAHEYVGLADATVHEHLVKMNGVFRALTRELEMLVESGDAG
jgi:uncharacterized protein YutE (UPF0331/DUF86 family)